VHLLMLTGFGGISLFPSRPPTFAFVSQNLGEEVEGDAEGPPGETESPPEASAEEPAVELPPQAEAAAMEEVLMLPEVSTPNAPALAPPAPGTTPGVASAPEVASRGPSGSGAGKPAGSRAGTPTFFGIPVEAEEARVVLVLDTSNTMFERKREGETYRFDFSVIKREAADLVTGLAEDSFFNVVIYESGSQAYAGQMVLATEGAKRQAEDWIQQLAEDPSMTIAKRPGPEENKLLEGRGTRLDTALKQTLGFKPTVVFVLTDGEVQRVEEGIFRWLGEMKKLKPAPQVHVVHYLTEKTKDEETKILRQIATRGGGKYRSVEAKTLAPSAP